MEINECRICPRQCGVTRLADQPSAGFCGLPALPGVCRADLHFGEEPNISGIRGSGTVFFSGCVLRCVFCQNHEISRKSRGKLMDVEELSALFFELVEKGAHNINLVSATPYVPVVAEALRYKRLPVPVVYNTGGYERVETLRLLEGLVDIYLPDYKYHTEDPARRYSAAADYPTKAKVAILEMLRQVGVPQHDSKGIMQRGLMVRHLVLPGHTKEAMAALKWLADSLPKDIYISLMAQYYPPTGLELPEKLRRRLTRREYDKVVNAMLLLGLEKGFTQQRSAAGDEMLPEWEWLEE